MSITLQLLRSIVFLTIGLSGQNSFATKLAKQYQTELSLAHRNLKSIGLTHLGDDRLSLDSLFEDMKNVKIQVLEELDKPGGATRYSAFFGRSNRTIYLSSSLSTRTAPLLTIFLHEALSTLGYGDKSYSISIPLSILANIHDFDLGLDENLPAAVALLKEYLTSSVIDIRLVYGVFFQNDDSSSNEVLKLAGGGNIAGGGGDVLSLDIHTKYMVEIWKRLPKNRRTVESWLIDSLLVTSFEPLPCSPIGNPNYFYLVPDNLQPGNIQLIGVRFAPTADPEKVLKDMIAFRDALSGIGTHPQLEAAIKSSSNRSLERARGDAFLAETKCR